MLIALLSSLSVAWATEVVFQGPSSSDIEYQAYLAAHAECSTPANTLAKQRPTQQARELLVAEFAESQKAFLSGDVQNAQRAIERLLSKMENEDWSTNDREVFLKSAFRRAQLADNPADAAPWLKLALAAGHDLTIDRTLFPPPLIEQYLKIKNSTPLASVEPAGLGSDWSVVLINGRRCTRQFCPQFPDLDVPVRITYLSNKWQPFTTVAAVKRLPQQTPPKNPWLNGICGDARFQPAAGAFSPKHAFFSLACSTPDKGQPINFKPVSQASAITMFDPPKKERPFYKSPWLWAGVGAVIAIVVAQSQKKHDEKKEPTTTYGY